MQFTYFWVDIIRHGDAWTAELRIKITKDTRIAERKKVIDL